MPQYFWDAAALSRTTNRITLTLKPREYYSIVLHRLHIPLASCNSSLHCRFCCCSVIQYVVQPPLNAIKILCNVDDHVYLDRMPLAHSTTATATATVTIFY